MQTQVSFRSPQFPPYEGEEAQINPGRWGKRLAEYLAEKLTAQGIEAEPPCAEDWGWRLSLRIDGQSLDLCCGHRDDGDDAYLCFTDTSKLTVRKFFRTIDRSPQFARLTETLKQILAADAEITEVTWNESIK